MDETCREYEVAIKRGINPCDDILVLAANLAAD